MHANRKVKPMNARERSKPTSNSQVKSSRNSRAEGTKRKNETGDVLFQAIADGTSDAIFTKDENGCYTFLNAAAANYLGKPIPELLGKTDAEIFQRIDAQKVSDADKTILQNGKEQTYEETLTVANGEKVTFLATKGPIFNNRGKIIGIYGISRDITARKRMEEAIRESEWRNKIVSELITDYIFVVDVESDGKLRLRWASDNMLRMTGRTPQEAETSDTWAQIIHPEDTVRFFDFIKKTLSTAQAGEIECRSYKKQSTERWIQVFVKPQLDENNRVTTIFGAVKDITEKKRAEIALRESEALYRQAIEAAGAVPYQEIYTPEGEIYVNYKFIGEGIRQITGYGPEEFNSVLWDTLILETQLVGDLAAYPREEAIRRVRAGIDPVWKCDFKIRARDGSIRWVFEAAIDLLDEHGGAYGSIGMFQDITDRKQTELALRESEKKHRLLFESANDSIFIMKDDRFIDCNAKTLEMFRCERDQIVGKKPSDFSPPTQLDGRNSKEKASEKINAVLKGKTQIFEWRHCHYDRTPFDAEVNLNLLELDNEVYIQAIVRDITERKQTEQKIENQLKRLYALRTIDNAISSSFDLRVTLEILLNQVITQLKVDAALILLFDKRNLTLNYAASRGFHVVSTLHTQLRNGESYTSRVVTERRTIHVPDLFQKGNDPLKPAFLPGEDFTSYIGTPLIAKGEIVGVLEIFQRSPITPEADWLDFLELLTGQAAIAIDNSLLFDNLKRSNFDLTQAYDATIEGWARALELRDKETEGHSRNVTELTLHLAQILGVPMDDLIHIRRGALLHDIGKMAIPDEILHKPSTLTPAEREIVMTHPDIAHGLLSPISFLEHAIEIPYYHHEKWDGSGYPQHLKGEEIPLAARIFAVVDVWDALRSKRPYRAAQSEEEAIQYIVEQSGKHFDPEVVNAFLRLYNQGWT